MAGRVREVSHEMGSRLNISPSVPWGVLEGDIIVLQNHMLVVV